jgi:serine protease Do
MNAKNIFTTFAIAVLSAFVGVIAYSTLFTSETKTIEIPVHVEPAARYAAIPAAPQVGFPDLTYAAEKTVHAVVHVQTKGRSSGGQSYSGHPFFDFFFGPRGMTPQEPQPVMGSGSGVILTNDGFIVTNNHVIDKADEITVTLNDKRTFKAVKVGADPYTDIALLKIDSSDLPFLQYGNSDNLKIGEWVLAVGNPFNLTSTVTAGIVSAKSRSIQILGQEHLNIEAFIQTDAAVNPGNSGGALVNTRGELVGINTAIASRTGSFTGYSFAVPSSLVEKVAADLMEFGEVQRGLIGVNIREIDNELAQKLKMDRARGVYVADVVEGGGAQIAGIKSGDVIISVNGDLINTVPQLQERVSRHRPGDNIQVEVIRDGKRKPFTITLRNIHGSTDIVQTSTILANLGANFQPATDAEKQQLRIRNGLKVTSVSAGKFRDAGIREGYVITQANRVPINSEDDLRKVVEVLNEGLFLTGIYTNGRVAYYAINLQD